MAEIQFGQNPPLPRLSRCQVEISQEPRGRSFLHFWLSVISSPSPHVFPPPYGHNDMSSDHCQYWNGELGRYCGKQGNYELVVKIQYYLFLAKYLQILMFWPKLAVCREIQTGILGFGGKSSNLCFQEVRS